MRDDDSNWFSKWEDELPSPEELTPLSQTLITPDLAIAFNIPNPHAPPLPPPPLHQSSQPNSSAEFDSLDLSAAAADEPARTLKRPRLVWTPQLHKRFVDAVAHLGIKNAVPKTIMQLMSVDGLTRENVASHLQKYRLYLKRMQGISSGDTAADHLFATSPVPPHFLHPGRAAAAAAGGSDHFMPFSPMAAPTHHHHQQQIMGQQPPSHHLTQQQFRQLGGSHPHGNAQFDQPFMKQPQQQAQRIGTPVHGSYSVGPPAYPTIIEPGNRRKVLTLFPTGDD